MPRRSKKKRPPPRRRRRPRGSDELLAALVKHVSLLHNKYDKLAFDHNSADFYGEVAEKLRLLVYRSKTCHPLLLDLMVKHPSISVAYTTDTQMTYSLEDYLREITYIFCSPTTNKLVEMSRMKVITCWPQQIGSSHEDPEINQDFAELLAHPTFVKGRQIATEQLRLASKAVLTVAEEFLVKYDRLHDTNYHKQLPYQL